MLCVLKCDHNFDFICKKHTSKLAKARLGVSGLDRKFIWVWTK